MNKNIKTHKATQVANIGLRELIDLEEEEKVLITMDESGLEENGEIGYALYGVAKEIGAYPVLVTIPDATAGDSQKHLPTVVEEGLRDSDVAVGLTKTTAASCIHHKVPDSLRAADELRTLTMVKRSYDVLTSDVALETDHELVNDIGTKVKETWKKGTEIHVTCPHGSDFTIGIDARDPPEHSGGYAHQPGQNTTITEGEAVIGPTVGSAEGVAYIDGQILEYGKPEEPIAVHMENGRVTEIRGSDPLADRLMSVVENNENADNIGEFAVGVNPIARQSSLFLTDANIAKKALGSAHIAIGSGYYYGQDVDSPVHIDLVMNAPTIEVDGREIFHNGEFTL